MTTINRPSALPHPGFFRGTRLVSVCLLGLYLLVAAPVQALDLLKPFSKLFAGDAGVVIWKGPGQYVTIVDQDWDYKHTRAPKNSHPVQLRPEELAIVLASIQAPDPEGSAIVPLFTRDEIRILAEKLPVALDRSQPDQDVVFGVVDNHGNVASGSRRSTGCRLFYQGGDLNMIFGDVLQPTDSIDDDTSHYAKPHRAGRRMESNGREIRVATGPGITHWQGRGMVRRDWITIDMHSAIAAYRGPQPGLQPQLVTKTAEVSVQQQQPVANYELSAENRKLREELARARKRMSQDQEVPESGSYGAAQNAPATPAPVMSSTAVEPRDSGSIRETRGYNDTAGNRDSDDIVQRLTTLKALYDKQLITGAEYDAKRKEILQKY
jgi:hypothetical protein